MTRPKKVTQSLPPTFIFDMTGSKLTVAGVTRAAATQAVVPFVAAGPLALSLALALTPAFAFAHLQFFGGKVFLVSLELSWN